MYKHATAIGLDIGRTEIQCAIVRYDGKIIYSEFLEYKEHPDRDLLLSYISESIKLVRKKSLQHNVNPLCIGIAGKGFVDYKNGIVIGPDRGIKGWGNVKLASIVGKETGLPVFVDNDANMMALAETTFGSAVGMKDILFMTLRSGIGGAVFIGGKLFRGQNNTAGEFGQMSINIDGNLSLKGIKGSLEYYASSTSMVKNYLDLSGKEYDSESAGPLPMRAKEIFDLAENNDKNAIKATELNAEYIGTGLANLISVYSPKIIVLGGGMSMAGDSYIGAIKRHAMERSLEYCNKDVVIVPALLGDSASIMGAAYYALTFLDGKSI